MRIVINAGHTKFNKGTGAVGFLEESRETRKIACKVMELLADTEHEVIPAIFDKSEDNLKEAVELANIKNAHLFVSIHLNAGGGQGSEIYTWKGKPLSRATKVLNGLANLGFNNRGIKDGSKLYVLKNTKCEAMLIEVCFIDNKTDVVLLKTQYDEVARAIVEGL